MSKNIKIIVGLIIIVLVVVLGYSMVGTQTSKAPVKIGAILPLTGWGSYWGVGEQKGIALAVKELKETNKNVDVILEDSATDATKAVTAAQKLISVDAVDGLIVEFSGPTTSVAPIANTAGVPFMYDAIVKSILDSNPFALKSYFDIEKQCSVAVEYFANKGYKKIASVMPALDFSPECKKGMTSSALKNNVSVSFYDFVYGSNDFKTIITKMKKDGIDAVVPTMYEDGASVFYKQKGQLGFTAPVFTGASKSDVFSDNIIASTPAQYIEGTITYNQQISDDFTAKIKILYPSITDTDIVSAAYGYDQVMYMSRAVGKCGKNPECVKNEVIKDKGYKSAVVGNGFGADRIMSPTPIYYKFTNGKLEKFDITK